MRLDIKSKASLFYNKYAFIFEVIQLLLIFPLMYIDFRVGIGYILILSSVWYYRMSNKSEIDSTKDQSKTDGYLSKEDIDQEAVDNINELIENQNDK